CNKIAPLWPLKHFVAVNPFLGFSDQSFSSTCATLRRVAGVDMLMPRAFYREALAAGRIEDRDLKAAVAATSGHAALASDDAALRRSAATD
ncbi:putative inorganic carbon transporter subunit DabA, partial [Acinetobacter baumannii]